MILLIIRLPFNEPTCSRFFTYAVSRLNRDSDSVRYVEEHDVHVARMFSVIGNKVLCVPTDFISHQGFQVHRYLRGDFVYRYFEAALTAADLSCARLTLEHIFVHDEYFRKHQWSVDEVNSQLNYLLI